MVENDRPRVGRMAQPTKTDEPYRLWFEFLKLAQTDPNITVNDNFYDAWGDYQSIDFKTWWHHNWLNLFAFDIGVYKITDFPKLLQDRRNEVIVRLPLYRSTRETIKQVKAVLAKEKAIKRIINWPKGQFYLNAGLNKQNEQIDPAIGFLKNLHNVGILLNFYRFWLGNKGIQYRSRVEKTSRDYYDWVKAGEQIARKDIGPDFRKMPPGLGNYVAYLDHRDGVLNGQPSLIFGEGDAESRRQIVRYINKAQTIAANVARGQFPGNYQ
jgi:hypothetical protein